MVGCVWRVGGESDEMGEGANSIDGSFEGGVRRDGGLQANSVGSGVSLSDAGSEKAVQVKVWTAALQASYKK